MTPGGDAYSEKENIARKIAELEARDVFANRDKLLVSQ
jgi:hypothetical protein